MKVLTSPTWTHTLPPGTKWSGTIGRGKSLRFTALESGANVSLLLYYAGNTSERYSMADTLKAQHTSHLTQGHVLMSDNGRAMAGIVEDSLGWHDTICGHSMAVETDAKYGKTRYQEKRNDRLRNGQENFIVELTRNGLHVRDLVPNMNLFSKVVCEEDGSLQFAEGHCKAGDYITLRTEMDLLLVLSNTPHPLDPSGVYPSVPVKIEVENAASITEDDECVNSRPEALRSYENTWRQSVLLSS